MIRIYGISADALPTVEAMQTLLGAQWTAVWNARHPSLEGSAARISLGGLYLLSQSGAEGILRYTDMGRPFLEEGKIDFSISHTRDAVFCAVALEGCSARIGLDVEDLGRIKEDRLRSLSRRWFGAEEKRIFEAAPDERTFLALWTRKEALVKRTGEGLRQMTSIDTYASCGENKAAFWTYWAGNTCVTLCADERARVASEITMLSV